VGPPFARPGRDARANAALDAPPMESLRYVFDAVASIKRALAGRVPLIGFAGSPFTLACYMIEGSGSDDFATVRRMAAARPELLDRLVGLNAEAVTAYLREQVLAGADAVMLFDTWGGMLSAAGYRRHSLASMRAVVASLAADPATRATPTIVFTKGGGGGLDDIAACGATAVGLDWTVDLAKARAGIGQRVALQGNLDPLVLLTDPATIEREAEAVVVAAGPAPGHVFNLGHGIVPSTPPEHVAALVETVHRVSAGERGA
jgi:uroporphyrinogen decarboxylase